MLHCSVRTLYNYHEFTDCVNFFCDRLSPHGFKHSSVLQEDFLKKVSFRDCSPDVRVATVLFSKVTFPFQSDIVISYLSLITSQKTKLT